MNRKTILTSMGLCLSLIILLSVFVPVFMSVDISSGNSVYEYVTGANLITNLFNNNYQGNNIAITLVVSYLMMQFANLLFIVFGFLRTKRVYIYRRLLISTSIVMIALSIIELVFGFMTVETLQVFTNDMLTKSYIVHANLYENLIISIILFATSCINGTYCAKVKQK